MRVLSSGTCAKSRRYEMARMFHRRLALPLSAIVLITVALTAPPSNMVLLPPATLFVIVSVGLASLILLMPGAIPGLRTSGALVRVLPSRHRDEALTSAAGACADAFDEPNGSTAAADALDLVRMDDDGAGR